MKIADFKLHAKDFGTFGHGLQRPECVWVDHDGVWSSDMRGGIAHVAQGRDSDVVGSGITEPNGFSRRPDGSFVVAGIGDGGVHIVSPGGDTRKLIDTFEGKPLGTVNYTCADGPDRIWLSVMTRLPHWYDALTKTDPDGYILRIEDDGKRCEIVADGLDLTNEVKLSPDGRHLYAAETMGCRIVRFPIRADGSLGTKEIVGPDSLGRAAMPDGISFDPMGNLWVTVISENALYVIDKRGDTHIVYRDMKEQAVEAMAVATEQRRGTVDHLVACASEGPIGLPTSIAFGGRTVYVGTLTLSHIATFQLPESLD
ncbi:MAG: SMP-30/gluconolactonase/LRE family protein [Rhizomicrobium sp.]